MDWYEPDEDSWTLVDLIVAEGIKDRVVIDLGCSTGVVSDALHPSNFVLCLDLNIKALRQLRNRDAIQMDLLCGIDQSRVDVVIFNPPYVPDFDCPILGGGKDGRVVIDRFVGAVTVPIVYLLVIEANKPVEVIEGLRARGYGVEVARIRKIVGETIVLLKAVQKTS